MRTLFLRSLAVVVRGLRLAGGVSGNGGDGVGADDWAWSTLNEQLVMIFVARV